MKVALVIFGFLASQVSASRPILTDDIFTAGSHIHTQASFWFDIYYHVGDDEGLLHHRDDLGIVYARIAADKQNSPAAREIVANETRRLELQLKALAGGESGSLSAEEYALRARLPSHWDSAALIDAAGKIRFQRGIKHRFREGIERSYRYLDMIDSTFRHEGIPTRLKYLPHVESSFLPHAYSKVGAAGMWQFMKASGKPYLTIGYHVDERRDPYRSTRAAGKLLKSNFGRLQTWPLALVAYNHGAGGMSRAIRQTGTRNLETIILNYSSQTFGFASKNFYAEFLAASSIAMQADSLYPRLEKWEPLRFHETVLSRASSPDEISRITGLSMLELEEYNLALRPTTFRRSGIIPKGYSLRLPVEVALADVDEGLMATVLAKTEQAAAPRIETALRDHVDNVPEKTAAVTVAVTGKKESKPGKELPMATTVMKPAGHPSTESDIIAAGVTLEGEAAGIPKPLPVAISVSDISETFSKGSGVDADFLLLSSDMEKLAHPVDRFEPGVYRLEHAYENGFLIILVGGEETLSHYAEWSGVPTRELRRVNRIRNSSDFRVNRSFRLPITDESRIEGFLAKREERYRAVEEDFYGNYHVSSLEPKIIGRGFNLWMWAFEQQIPFWLLQKHNPGKNLQQLQAGETVTIPQVETGIRRWGFTRYAGSQEYHKSVAEWISRPTL